MKLLLATSNRHKVEEIRSLLADTDFIIYTLQDFPEIVLPPEDGATFEANASIKALAASEVAGLVTLADDSGLEVDYLSGAPGVYSARFAGEEKNDVANNAKLLRLLEGVPRQARSARFRCAIAIAVPEVGVKVCNGCCEGIIGEKLVGQGGFGTILFYICRNLIKSGPIVYGGKKYFKPSGQSACQGQNPAARP